MLGGKECLDSKSLRVRKAKDEGAGIKGGNSTVTTFLHTLYMLQDYQLSSSDSTIYISF